MKTEYRFLSDSELIGNVVNENRFDVQSLSNVDFNTVIETLTPARRQLAESIIELYKRSLHQVGKRTVIQCSKDIYHLMQPFLCDLQVEEFWLIGLNQSCKVINKIRISTGGIAGTFVDVRIVVKELIKMNATQCAILHNHPSGAVKPSQEDKILTDKIKKGTELLNIRLIDHIIIGHDAYYSFADEGMI